MSRRLYLLRHFKSSWDDPDTGDRDRPLAPRGRKAGRRMAAHLRREHVRPDLVLVSPARRAVESFELVAGALPSSAGVSVEDTLYGMGHGELLERLRDVAASAGTVLVIGHNPTLQDLALLLASSGAALTQVRERFPTGALACLDVPGEGWDRLAPRSAVLVSCVVPRELRRRKK